MPVEAYLETLGSGGVGSDAEGMEEPRRVTETRGASVEDDARAVWAADCAPIAAGQSSRSWEADRDRRKRGDCTDIREGRGLGLERRGVRQEGRRQRTYL